MASSAAIQSSPGDLGSQENKNLKAVIPKKITLHLRPSRHGIIGQGPTDLGPSPDPRRDLICSVFSSGVKFDDFGVGCLPGSAQLLIKSLRRCSDSSMVDLGKGPSS